MGEVISLAERAHARVAAAQIARDGWPAARDVLLRPRLAVDVPGGRARRPAVSRRASGARRARRAPSARRADDIGPRGRRGAPSALGMPLVWPERWPAHRPRRDARRRAGRRARAAPRRSCSPRAAWPSAAASTSTIPRSLAEAAAAAGLGLDAVPARRRRPLRATARSRHAAPRLLAQGADEPAGAAGRPPALRRRGPHRPRPGRVRAPALRRPRRPSSPDAARLGHTPRPCCGAPLRWAYRMLGRRYPRLLVGRPAPVRAPRRRRRRRRCCSLYVDMSGDGVRADRRRRAGPRAARERASPAGRSRG